MRVTKDVQKRAEEKYKVLENKMKNADAEREKELKAAQQNLNAAKAKADTFNKKLKQMQQVHRPDTHTQSHTVSHPLNPLLLLVNRSNEFLFLLMCAGLGRSGSGAGGAAEGAGGL